MTTRDQDYLRHFISEIVRVWKRGGEARLALPHPDTGQLIFRDIDQQAAAEIIASLCDRVAAEDLRNPPSNTKERMRHRRLLRFYFESLPVRYDWITEPGSHWLRPLNAGYGHPSKPPIWLRLADHPSTYDLGWLEGGPTRNGEGPSSETGFLTLNPNKGILYQTTRLLNLNEAKWRDRLQHEALQSSINGLTLVAWPDVYARILSPTSRSA